MNMNAQLAEANLIYCVEWIKLTVILSVKTVLQNRSNAAFHSLLHWAKLKPAKMRQNTTVVTVGVAEPVLLVPVSIRLLI